MLRDRLDEIEAQTEHEKEWWEKRRGAIRSEFMKELEEADNKSVSATSHDEPVLVDTNTPSTPGSPSTAASKKGKK